MWWCTGVSLHRCFTTQVYPVVLHALLTVKFEDFQWKYWVIETTNIISPPPPVCISVPRWKGRPSILMDLDSHWCRSPWGQPPPLWCCCLRLCHQADYCSTLPPTTLYETHTVFIQALIVKRKSMWLHFLSPAARLPVSGASRGKGSSDLWPWLRGPDPDHKSEVQQWGVVQNHIAKEQT